MFEQSCPVIVLDDEKEELWAIAHGLSVCGLPTLPHLVQAGKLERKPASPYQGVRILFSDLHILGAGGRQPQMYVPALVRFIQDLIAPSTYLIVFWSSYAHEADDAWTLLCKSLVALDKPGLIPFAYSQLSKEDVKLMSDENPGVAEKAKTDVKASIDALFQQYPQLNAFMQWESCASRAASKTSNELIGKLAQGGVDFSEADKVRDTLKRMAQEAMGPPHAIKTPTKGVYQSLVPIIQDNISREAETGALNPFLNLLEEDTIPLPQGAAGKPNVANLLNDFFIHSACDDEAHLERGAVIRLSDNFLASAAGGLTSEIGLTANPGDWQEAICMEFMLNFQQKNAADKATAKLVVKPENVYVLELSADCDFAQEKPRSHRFLLVLFVPTDELNLYYSKSKKSHANESIYSTPDITVNGVAGRFLVSCRVYLTRPYQQKMDGKAITRMRPEVLAEIAHHYSTHMRRPGKVAFY